MTRAPQTPVMNVSFTDACGQQITVGDTVIYPAVDYAGRKRQVFARVIKIELKSVSVYNRPTMTWGVADRYNVIVLPTGTTYGQLSDGNGPVAIKRWDNLIKIAAKEMAA